MVQKYMSEEVDRFINHDGEIWRILSTGRTREDGKTFCHLAHTISKYTRKNGFTPKQITDWITHEEQTVNFRFYKAS